MKRKCASPEELQRILSGHCDPGWLEELGVHVDQCALCQQALDEVMRSTSSPGAAVGLQRPALSPRDDALLARVRNTTRAGDGDTEVAPDGLPDVPGFVVEALLGIGGQGAVVRARQLRLGGRLVALKLIGVQSRMLFREHLTRFQIEAEAFARLAHPNIVRIYEIAEHDSLPYLVLEYVEGGTLSEKLGRGPLAPRDAVRLLATIARAVHYAHSQGVIHRDLKPRNILLTRDGDPKISDFGLAGFVESGSGPQHANRGLGTKEYMSPEQWSGQGPVADARSDQWSLGVILYELLCRHRPFAGESSATIARAIREKSPPPMRELPPRMAVDLEAICGRCLAKKPEDRYPSCQHLAEDLECWVRGEPITARPILWPERLTKWCRRKPAKAAVVVTGLCLLLAIGVAWAKSIEARNARLNSDLADAREKATSFALREAEADQRIAEALARSSDALLLVQSGRWIDAIARFDDAIASGHPDPDRLRLEQIKCKLFLGKGAETAAELQPLLERKLTPELRAEASVWRGFGLLGTNKVEATALINAAQRNGEIKDPAEMEFLAGLRAEDFETAARHFQETLRLKPYHQVARQMLCAALYFLGRLDDAVLNARIALSFNPGDHGTLAFLALMQYLQDDRESAEANLLSLEESGAKHFAQELRKLLQTIDKLQNITYQELDRAILLKTFPDVIESIKGMKDDMFAQYPLPPQIEPSYLKFFEFALTMTTNPTAALEKATATHKERTLLVMLGQLYANQGKWRNAKNKFEEAEKTAGFLRFDAEIDYYLARLNWQVSYESPVEEAARLQEQSASYVRRLMTRAKLPAFVTPSNMKDLAEIVWAKGDRATCRAILARWAQMAADDSGVSYFGALIDLSEGNTLGALQGFIEAKRRGAKGPAVDEKIQEVRERLRSELQKGNELLSDGAP